MILPESAIAQTRALMADAFDTDSVATITIGPWPKPLSDELRMRVGQFRSAAAKRADAHLVIETDDSVTVHAFVKNNPHTRSAT